MVMEGVGAMDMGSLLMSNNNFSSLDEQQSPLGLSPSEIDGDKGERGVSNGYGLPLDEQQTCKEWL